MAAHCQSEIWGIRFPFHGDAIQSSRIMALGTQNSAQPPDGSQIGVRKAVVTRYCRISRILLVKWPEQSCRMDVPRRTRIDQLCIKSERFSATGTGQLNIANVEL